MESQTLKIVINTFTYRDILLDVKLTDTVGNLKSLIN